MPSFIPLPGETHDIELRELSDHPLLAPIPTWPRDSAEFGGLVESIRDHGLDYPLLVDTAFQVVDGRNRRNAIAVLGGLGGARATRVPCKFVAREDAASIIVSCLANRRNLSKGALAYLCAPMFDAVLAESKARRVANLRQNGKLAGDAQVVGNVDPLLSRGSVKSAIDVAVQMGIGRALYEQAVRLHRMFAEAGPEARAKYEPRLLGLWQDEDGEWNDPVGLGYMINGVRSLLDGKASTEESLAKRNEHPRLFEQSLGKLKLHWEKAAPEERNAIRERMRQEIVSWPVELVEMLQDTARAASRELAKQKVEA